jgi:hypothetical protein
MKKSAFKFERAFCKTLKNPVLRSVGRASGTVGRAAVGCAGVSASVRVVHAGIRAPISVHRTVHIRARIGHI